MCAPDLFLVCVCAQVVVGATNRPYDIDEAVRRRLVKRIYIPLPAEEGRLAVLQKLLRGQQSALSSRDLAKVVKATDGYSASDLTALCEYNVFIHMFVHNTHKH